MYDEAQDFLRFAKERGLRCAVDIFITPLTPRVEEKTDDKIAGYITIYEIFLGLSELLAPFIPFITEEVYLNLKTDDMPGSIHLCNDPEYNKKYVDEELETGMNKIRELVEIGRAMRSKIGIKVRYPLKSATLVCDKKTENSIKNILDLLNEEINVKNIYFLWYLGTAGKRT